MHPYICKWNILDIKEFIIETNLGCDTNMIITIYHSQFFKHVIMGHYSMPLKHFCDVIRQYWLLFYCQQPIGRLYFLTLSANKRY